MKFRKIKNDCRTVTLVPKSERRFFARFAVRELGVGALYGIAFLVAIIIVLALLGPVCRMIQAF